MTVLGIDHVAVPVDDLPQSIEFYSRVLAATPAGPPYQHDGKTAVQQMRIGGAVLSLHQAGNGLDLVAHNAAVGSLDVCFHWAGTVEEVLVLFAEHDLQVVAGPAPRRTAQGRPAQSVYTRDPDGNLLEFMVEDAAHPPASD